MIYVLKLFIVVQQLLGLSTQPISFFGCNRAVACNLSVS